MLSLEIGVAALLGLAVGSFLNVVVYRLPKILERQWAAECASLAGTVVAPQERFDLVSPRSRCPSCGHTIRWHENIPVISYLLLRGRCSACATPIGLRYPVVELATAALSSYCIWRWGYGAVGLMWVILGTTLLTLALIDWDTTLLPDIITQPLLWLGLIFAAAGVGNLELVNALWGAVAGYLSLWSIYWIFKILTGKDGMGFGDFKLFAALGAWFGWQGLVPIILMASVIGTAVGLGMKLTGGLREGRYVPFGPFLAAAGITAMLVGPQSILRFAGL